MSLLDLIINYTKKEFLQLQERKIYGPLIKVLNYRIELKDKQ